MEKLARNFGYRVGKNKKVIWSYFLIDWSDGYNVEKKKIE